MNDMRSSWFLFLLVYSLWLSHSIKTDLGRRLARLETKVDGIRSHLGLSNEAAPATVDGLVQAGQKIEAIKAYREATGASLKDAKDEVERIAGKTATPP